MKKFLRQAIFIVILLLAFQGPQLIEQYIDHLQGHVEELKYQVSQFEAATGKQGQEVQRLIKAWEEKLEIKEPILFISRLFERYLKLTADFEIFRHAPFWSLPVTFLLHLDQSILQETLSSYHWGLNISFAALPFVILGLLFGWLLTYPLKT